MNEKYDGDWSEVHEEAASHIRFAIELLVDHRRNTHGGNDLSDSCSLTDTDLTVGQQIIDEDLREILLSEYVRYHAEANGMSNLEGMHNKDRKTMRIMTYTAWQLVQDLGQAENARKPNQDKRSKNLYARWNTWRLADMAYELSLIHI